MRTSLDSSCSMSKVHSSSIAAAVTRHNMVGKGNVSNPLNMRQMQIPFGRFTSCGIREDDTSTHTNVCEK